MTEIKRLNYFTGQFLVEKDFQDEQKYHLEMRRRHNRCLHSWGIADGLQVDAGPGDKTVTVRPGLAIDKDGNEIVLLDSCPVDLKDFGANAIVYVTARYVDTEWDDHDKDKADPQKYIRRTEKAKIEAKATVPATDGSVIPLATVLDGSGNIEGVDNGVRRPAGPAPGAVSGPLTITGLLTAAGGIAMNDQDIRLRTGGDGNHFLGYKRNYGGITGLDGPVLTGNAGGGLAVKNGDKLALSWKGQDVTVHSSLKVENGATVKKGLTVENALTIAADGTATFKKGLTVEDGAVFIKGPRFEQSATFVAGPRFEQSATFVAGPRFEQSATFVAGPRFEQSATFVAGPRFEQSATFVAGPRFEQSATFVAGARFEGDATFKKGLTVEGAATLKKSLILSDGSPQGQGIGFSYNTIYATGPSQSLTLQARGGRVEIVQESWQVVGQAGAPAFQNNWVNWGGVYNTAAYFKDSLGIVHLRGLVKDGTLGADKAIFTLPAGYRPALRELHIVCTNNRLKSPYSDTDFGRLDITQGGDVIALSAANGFGIGSFFGPNVGIPVDTHTQWISLDGITFRAAPQG